MEIQKTSASDSLKASILLLENRRAIEWELLKEQSKVVHSNIRPLNLIKSAFREITTSSDIKSNMVDTTIGMTTGYLAKKALRVVSRNPLTKVLGMILQIGVTNVVTKHPDAIKFSGIRILKRIFSGK